MSRRISLAILIMLVCQTGCSSLFNPDKSIAAALTSYFPDSDAATLEMERQLNRAVSEADRMASESEVPMNSDREMRNPATMESTPPLTPLPGSSTSSWEKIEQAIQTEPENPIQPTPFENPESPNSESNASVEKTQKKLIQIYDKISSAELPKNYQPLPLLIQRPLIYDQSIVRPPLENIENVLTDNEPKSDISWKDSLEATIAHLKEELKSLKPKSKEANKLNQCLNVLNSVDTDKDFVGLMDKLTELQSSLPQHQFDAIRKVIETTENSKSNLIDQLKTAVSKVAKSAELKALNATFCTAVEGFGKFERFPTNQFRAGDEVLLYCELENFEEEKHTDTDKLQSNICKLDAQVEFLDPKDETVYIESFANITDESESDRKDFYLFFRFHIPKLPPGSHKVQIRFHDKIGRKHATLERPLTFTVVR